MIEWVNLGGRSLLDGLSIQRDYRANRLRWWICRGGGHFCHVWRCVMCYDVDYFAVFMSNIWWIGERDVRGWSLVQSTAFSSCCGICIFSWFMGWAKAVFLDHINDILTFYVACAARIQENGPPGRM